MRCGVLLMTKGINDGCGMRLTITVVLSWLYVLGTHTDTVFVTLKQLWLHLV